MPVSHNKAIDGAAPQTGATGGGGTRGGGGNGAAVRDARAAARQAACGRCLSGCLHRLPPFTVIYYCAACCPSPSQASLPSRRCCAPKASCEGAGQGWEGAGDVVGCLDQRASVHHANPCSLPGATPALVVGSTCWGSTCWEEQGGSRRCMGRGAATAWVCNQGGRPAHLLACLDACVRCIVAGHPLVWPHLTCVPPYLLPPCLPGGLPTATPRRSTGATPGSTLRSATRGSGERCRVAAMPLLRTSCLATAMPLCLAAAAHEQPRLATFATHLPGASFLLLLASPLSAGGRRCPRATGPPTPSSAPSFWLTLTRQAVMATGGRCAQHHLTAIPMGRLLPLPATAPAAASAHRRGCLLQ